MDEVGSGSTIVSSKMIEVTDSLLSSSSDQLLRAPSVLAEYTEEPLMDESAAWLAGTGRLCNGVLPGIMARRAGGTGRGLSASMGDFGVLD